MKKYIITDADLDYLESNCFYPLPAKAIAADLKPIEPLSEEVIWEIYKHHAPCVGFARAIEAHITGHVPESTFGNIK